MGHLVRPVWMTGSDKEVELITVRRVDFQLSSGLGVDGRSRGVGEALLSWKFFSSRSGHGQSSVEI